MRYNFFLRSAGWLSAVVMLTIATSGGALAQGFPDPNTCNPAECGGVSPLIPMQSGEAVHMGLVWKKNSQSPKILYHSRFPEYTPNDMADPALTDLAISLGAFSTPGLQFNSSLRDVLHGFDPFLGLGMNRNADDSFQRLTYGGYTMRQGLSQSVPTRIVANRTMERQLLFDISHPDAFKNSGKFHTAVLDEADFAMNRAAFAENGYSKGMFYNTYCNARVTLSDSRVYVFGGHDNQSNNGIYKVNIFDPETETWVKRSEPCTRRNWTNDPFGKLLFASNPDAPFYPNCDPRNQQSTHAVRPVRPGVRPLVSVGGSAAERPGAGPRRVRPGRHRRARSRSGDEGASEPDPERHGVYRDARQHRGAGGLRPEDRSQHRARERADGVPALSADGGRPDRARKRRLEGLHHQRRDQLRHDRE